jgi:hypothetical protein
MEALWSNLMACESLSDDNALGMYLPSPSDYINTDGHRRVPVRVMSIGGRYILYLRNGARSISTFLTEENHGELGEAPGSSL